MNQPTIEQGWAHHQAGRIAEAEAVYRQLLHARPDHPDALHLMGVLAMQVGRWEIAVRLLRAATTARPGFSEAHNTLGNALQATGDFVAAIAEYRRALEIKPELADAHNNLSNALRESGELNESIDEAQRALELRPEYPEALNNLGNSLHQDGQLDKALNAFRQAISIRPEYPEAQYNLGATLLSCHRPKEAISALQNALSLRPTYAEAAYQLGNAYRALAQLDESIAAYRRALTQAPNFVPAHFNLGLTLLLKGELPEGWTEFEWRWKLEDYATHFKTFARPRWDGADLAGRRILLHGEQGLGDVIQFARYASQVAERGGKVILASAPELARLMSTLGGVEQIVTQGDSAPDHELHCSLLDLPRIFGTSMDSIPANAPYLHAEPQWVNKWSGRFPNDAVNVGLAWAGRSSHANDHNRSMDPTLLTPLGAIPNVRLISLQKDAGPDAGSQFIAIDPMSEVEDFADTAGLIECLDLIITVDTAVAHLAGAMGKTVWILLPFIPDWRWMLNRDDSRWYRSARLFRQPVAGDWATPIRAVTEALGTMASQR